MTREDKVTIIAELSDKFKSNAHFYITDSSGLSVADVNKFRSLCYKQGIEYKVYKNTLIKKALETLDADFAEINPALKGFSGVLFSKENANAPAKLIKSFQKDDPKDRPRFKAASIDTDIFLGENQLDALVRLKSKQELIGDVIAILQSPAKNVLSALMSGQNKLAGIVKTLSERE